VALFAQRKRDVILRDASGFNVTGGRTRHEGVEAEIGWQMLPSLRIDVAGTYARHRYDFDAAIEGGETIVKGRDIDTAPRQMWTTTLTWSPREHWQTALEWRRVGAYFADAANTRRHPGHDVAHLRVSAQPSSEWRVSLEIENLTDARYADRADFAQGDWRYFPARGPSAFVTVEWRRE
jgi:outer membrane receptor protein involved in Fe transport